MNPFRLSAKVAKKVVGRVGSGATEALARQGVTLNRINLDDVALYERLYGSESVKNRRFYNISVGSYLGFGGGLHHPCWTCIDVDRPWKNADHDGDDTEYDPRRDIAHDLLSLQPIPVDSSVAELVHTRFTIASIMDAAAALMFSEVFRMLKPGGIFRISTPNIDLDYRAYLHGDRSFFYWFAKRTPPVSIEQAFLFHVASQLSLIHPDGAVERITDDEFRELLWTMGLEDALDHCISKCSVEIQKRNRQDHMNWWNSKKLERMLGAAGFKAIYYSTREQSASPVLRNNAYFDNEDNRFVMYMEAVKT
jgi:hypothetical protein